MFGLQFKGKTVNEGLKIIDDKVEELNKDMDNTFLELEGYAKAKDMYNVRSCVRKLEGLEESIRVLGYLRIDIEYM